jgi:preprotein translocase subunit YajC
MAICVAEWSGWMFAMWLQSGAGGGLGSIGSLALPILFFVALYFLMIAPNQRKQKKWQEMLGQLKSGDRVTTNGGIRGTVLTVKDDVVVLRVQPDGVKLEFVKSAIAAVTTDEQAA